VRVEQAIGEDSARRMARASVLYRLSSPAVYGAVVVELALAVAFAVTGRTGAAIALAVLAVALPAILWLTSGSIERALRHRGFRPGTTMVVDWADDGFTVVTPDGSASYRYDHVGSARAIGGAVVLRIAGARVLLLLPAAVVPPEARPRLSRRWGARP
jgi:hypothetical protein